MVILIWEERFPKRDPILEKILSWSCWGISRLVTPWTSWSTVRTRTADVAKVEYADRTDDVEGRLLRENMMDGISRASSKLVLLGSRNFF